MNILGLKNRCTTAVKIRKNNIDNFGSSFELNVVNEELLHKENSVQNNTNNYEQKNGARYNRSLKNNIENRKICGTLCGQWGSPS